MNQLPSSYSGYYYSEPSFIDEYGSLFLFLGLGFALFLFFVRWRLDKTSADRRYNLFKSAVIFSPVWLPLFLFFLFFGLHSILRGQLNFFLIISVSLMGCIFLYLYCLAAVYPAHLAHKIAFVLNERNIDKKRHQVLTFWTLLDKIKKRRSLYLFLLVVFIVLLLLVNSFLLSGVFTKYGAGSAAGYGFLPLLLFFALALLFIYAIFEIFYHSKVDVPRTEHGKSAELRQTIEKLSIATGLPAPDFQVLAVNNPTAFSLFPNFGKPTIYITAPLLNMADNSELKAVVAHEFAQIFSGRALYFKDVQNLLIFLRVLAFFLLFLFLIKIDPFLLAFWAFIFCRIFIGVAVSTRKKEGNLSVDALFRLFNPPLALVNFLSYFIYYESARNEEFYADIKTIEFTRYPRGIYSILEKLENYKGRREELPNRFSYLYFTGENTSFTEIPMPQPLIQERREFLRQTDPSLKGLSDFSEKKNKRCLNCHNLTEETMLNGFYGNFLLSDYCKKCDGFWLEDESLWLISDLPDNLKDKIKTDTEINRQLICPKCGINIVFLEDKSLPVGVEIWYCPVCRGQWVFKRGVLSYLAYRKRFTKDKR